MSTDIKTYMIVSRYMIAGEGWRKDEMLVTGTYEQAGYKASSLAKELDARFGDDHFWTVDLENSTGSFFQLFHGRTS